MKHTTITKRQCTAISRKSGERCRQRPTVGRNTCRIHGGTNQRDLTLPQNVRLALGQSLPESMVDGYKTALIDPELLSLRRHIAVAEERLKQVLTLIRDGGESARAWQAVLDTQDHLRKLVEAENRREAELRQHMTLEQALLFSRALADAVKKHVTDWKVRQRIIDEINGVIHLSAEPEACEVVAMVKSTNGAAQ